MSDAAQPADSVPKRRSGLRGMLVALVLAAILGGGAFYAAWSGLVTLPQSDPRGAAAQETRVAYVPLRDIVVTVGPPGQGAHLLFSADIEVRPEARSAVAAMTPRFIDVLNGYLRALEPEEIAAPAALVRLRAQMLRRLQLVAGEGMIRDLLIIEFVLR